MMSALCAGEKGNDYGEGLSCHGRVMAEVNGLNSFLSLSLCECY